MVTIPMFPLWGRARNPNTTAAHGHDGLLRKISDVIGEHRAYESHASLRRNVG